MKWNDQELKEELLLIMKDYDLIEMPSRQFLEGINRTDLFNAIARRGGFIKFADKMDIPRRKSVSKWTLEKIEEELLNYVKEKNLNRMPSKPELIKDGRNDIGNALTRYKGMKYWSERTGLPLKQSETNKGNRYERITTMLLEDMGHQVKEMTTKYPYDLLINENVKIDVKVSSPGDVKGWRCHTFRPSKEYPTCDLYICIALDEREKIEKVFIIPSKFAQVTTLCIGAESKYNGFIERWDYIDRYTEFYRTLGATP